MKLNIYKKFVWNVISNKIVNIYKGKIESTFYFPSEHNYVNIINYLFLKNTKQTIMFFITISQLYKINKRSTINFNGCKICNKVS